MWNDLNIQCSLFFWSLLWYLMFVILWLINLVYIIWIICPQVRVRNLYTVKLTHGPFHWVVKRKYKHFQELHRDLYKHKMMLHFMPIRRSVSRLTCKSASYSGGRVFEIWVMYCFEILILDLSSADYFEYSNSVFFFFFQRPEKERQLLRAMSEEMPSLQGTERARGASSKTVSRIQDPLKASWFNFSPLQKTNKKKTPRKKDSFSPIFLD